MHTGGDPRLEGMGGGHLVLIRIQPYLDYGEHASPILPVLVVQGGTLTLDTSSMAPLAMSASKPFF